MANALERSAAATTVPAADFGAQRMSFADLLAMGAELVRTGFLPDHIKTGAQAAAVVMAGAELGMAPMRALRSMRLVKGNVTEAADSILARFKTAGGVARWEELSDTVATLYLRHPNGDEHVETFTLADATRAGLLANSRNGEPSMYKKYPKALLRSRAITAGIKSIGWDGGAGVYDPHELAHLEEEDEKPRSAPRSRRLAPGELPATAAIVDGETAEDAGEAGESGEEERPAEAPRAEREPATAPQKEFLAKLLASSVFTEEERAFGERIRSKAKASRAIEWAKGEIDRRAAAAAAAPAEEPAEAPAEAGETMLDGEPPVDYGAELAAEAFPEEAPPLSGPIDDLPF